MSDAKPTQSGQAQSQQSQSLPNQSQPNQSQPTATSGLRIGGKNSGKIVSESANKVECPEGYAPMAGVDVNGDNTGDVNMAGTNSTTVVPRGSIQQGSAFTINGYMSILNQGFNRPGSEADVETLQKTFAERGVKIEIKRDPKLCNVHAEIGYLADKDFTGLKLFALFYMSHGHQNGTVCAKDWQFDVKSTVVDPIMQNESLNGVPKIFVIVACRGHKRYEKCSTKKMLGKDDSAGTVDTSFDTRFYGAAGMAPWLIAYSTLDDHVSLRYPNGTAYIQSLCRHMNEATGDTSIHSLFGNVYDELEKEGIQIPFFNSAMGNVFFRDLA